jgi:hypothetical protein
MKTLINITVTGEMKVEYKFLDGKFEGKRRLIGSIHGRITLRCEISVSHSGE